MNNDTKSDHLCKEKHITFPNSAVWKNWGKFKYSHCLFLITFKSLKSVYYFINAKGSIFLAYPLKIQLEVLYSDNNHNHKFTTRIFLLLNFLEIQQSCKSGILCLLSSFNNSQHITDFVSFMPLLSLQPGLF